MQLNIGVIRSKNNDKGEKPMIMEFVSVPFDPQKSSTEIQQIFADELARTLWLAIRPTHAASQYFNAEIMNCAKAIRVIQQKEEELDVQTLFRILSGFGRRCDRAVIGSKEDDFAVELLPFVLGEKVIAFEIETEFENPKNFWHYEGSFSVELLPDTPTNIISGVDDVSIKGNVVSFADGMVFQSMGGISIRVGTRNLHWRYCDMKAIREANGKLIWKNTDSK